MEENQEVSKKLPPKGGRGKRSRKRYSYEPQQRGGAERYLSLVPTRGNLDVDIPLRPEDKLRYLGADGRIFVA